MSDGVEGGQPAGQTTRQRVNEFHPIGGRVRTPEDMRAAELAQQEQSKRDIDTRVARGDVPTDGSESPQG